jgi:glyoxylase-like metal-dependent hydrolase (beta-lactamase superfamily II)
MRSEPWPDAKEFGPVTVLTGVDAGAYPHGNSVLVAGSRETVLFDPSLSVFERGGVPQRVDRIVLSHVHEDHIPGHVHFPDVPLHAHAADAPGIESLEGMLQIFGYDAETSEAFHETLIETFHFVPRTGVQPFEDGAVFDLGGVHVEVIHLPGHTRGHCGLLVPEARALFLGDIELTGFGPYYGDAWSDLEDFEASLARCRDIDADHFITFHHKGTISGRGSFLERLEAFAAVIQAREQRLLEFLREPHTLAECVAHRFVFRPHVEKNSVNAIERRAIELHIERLTRSERVLEDSPGRYRSVS